MSGREFCILYDTSFSVLEMYMLNIVDAASRLLYDYYVCMCICVHLYCMLNIMFMCNKYGGWSLVITVELNFMIVVCVCMCLCICVYFVRVCKFVCVSVCLYRGACVHMYVCLHIRVFE